MPATSPVLLFGKRALNKSAQRRLSAGENFVGLFQMSHDRRIIQVRYR